MKTNKSRIEIGDMVEFHSGNYQGLTGEIIATDWNAKIHPTGLDTQLNCQTVV